MFKKIIYLAVFTLFSFECYAQVLSATVADTKVPMGEVFDLTLVLDGNAAGSLQPDLRGLRQDFQIYSTSSSMQSSFVNGQGSTKRSWTIGLMPKKEGQLEIPAISVGKYQSQPISINVVPQGSYVPAKAAATAANQATGNEPSATAAQPKVDATLTVDSRQAFVQQEVNAVLTIVDHVGIDITSQPYFVQDNGDWTIKILRQPSVDNNGQGERIIKFYYAMFPQKSGDLTIPEIRVDGYYVDFEREPETGPRSMSGFLRLFDMDLHSMFGVKKPIAMQTEPVQVKVLPAPAAYGSAWWLPSTAVGIAARWEDMQPTFKVGETQAREIVLVAEGVAETQLPELVLPESPNIKQYPEKPQVEAIVGNNRITSKMSMRVVYIPQESGEQLIPEISVPWYNVATQTVEKAVLPAQKIMVQAGSGKSTVVADTEPASPSSSTKPTQPSQYEDVTQPQTNKLLTQVGLGVIVLLAFLAGLLISYLLLKKRTPSVGSEAADLKNVEKALEQKDYRALRDALTAYGQKLFAGRSINNLQDLSEAVGDAEFAAQMQTLNGILYADQSGDLVPEIILRGLKQKKTTAARSEDEPLPKLYK